MIRSFQHTEDEFQILVTWMVEEGQKLGIRNEPPDFVRTLKLFIRIKCNGRISLLYHVQGLTSDVVLSRENQVLFTMEELIRVGKIYFFILDMTNDEFINFRRVVDSSSKHDDILSMMHAFNTLQRDNVVRGCLHIITIGKMDDLRLMWVARPGVDIHHICVSFCRILLLRENIDIEYCFG